MYCFAPYRCIYPTRGGGKTQFCTDIPREDRLTREEKKQAEKKKAKNTPSEEAETSRRWGLHPHFFFPAAVPFWGG
jgi:hypothetical protein